MSFTTSLKNMKNEVLDKKMSAIMNRTVLFTNISGEVFKCSWDSQPFSFKPGESRYMEFWRARHFAKHLTNKILEGVPGGEQAQSPKEINGRTDNVIFNEYFTKALKELDDEGRVIGEDELIDINKRQDEIEEIKQEKTVAVESKKEEPTIEEEQEEEFGAITESKET